MMNPIDDEQPLYRYSIDGFFATDQFVIDQHEGRRVTTAELVDIANRCDEAEQKADRLQSLNGKLRLIISELTSEDKRPLPFE